MTYHDGVMRRIEAATGDDAVPDARFAPGAFRGYVASLSWWQRVTWRIRLRWTVWRIHRAARRAPGVVGEPEPLPPNPFGADEWNFT